MSSDSTIQSSGARRVEAALRRRFLIILYQDRGSRVLELADGQEIVVGRGPDVDLIIEDGKTSRRHSRLWRKGDRVFVEDLGSTNGTRVNGVGLSAQQRLGPGDEVGVGLATLVVSSLTLAVGQHRLLTDGELEERLEAEMDRAKRFRHPLSLVMIRLAGPVDGLRRQLAAIAAIVRRMDVLASYGPRDYALLLPETDRAASETVVARLTAAVGGPPESVALGIGTSPTDAHSAGMLLEIARDRLREARGARAPAAVREPSARRTIVAESRAMIQTLTLARRIGAVETTVLVLGETGSGKQVVAEEIHRSSPRAKGPLVQVNCAAIPASLVESQLFGHERGAFTGADSRHSGYIEAAAGGTLFLDEIGELPEPSQPKLLHVLESQSYMRVGGVRPLPTNVRIIAATNRDLEAEVKAGRFRQDLYYRLSAFMLHIPPLRERREDLIRLAGQFCVEFADALGQPTPSLSEGALRAIASYDWPGNVRQLRNAIERAVVLTDSTVIEAAHLPERVAGGAAGNEAAVDGRLDDRLATLEAKTIAAVLLECNGNQSEAARRLGISRRSLIYRMGKLGLR